MFELFDVIIISIMSSAATTLVVVPLTIRYALDHKEER